jgi:hypothetical protein
MPSEITTSFLEVWIKQGIPNWHLKASGSITKTYCLFKSHYFPDLLNKTHACLFSILLATGHMQSIEEHIIMQNEGTITLYPELCLEWEMYVNELEFE